MSIRDLSLDQLHAFEGNYLKANKTEGGKYSLADVRLEIRRRIPSQFDTRDVARKIVQLACASHDGLVTYGELWKALLPDTPWKGQHSQSVMSATLGRVISYCVRNNLPVLTVLVVQANPRALSDEAVANITNECRSLGVDIGAGGMGFINKQMTAARALTTNALPDEAD